VAIHSSPPAAPVSISDVSYLSAVKSSPGRAEWSRNIWRNEGTNKHQTHDFSFALPQEPDAGVCGRREWKKKIENWHLEAQLRGPWQEQLMVKAHQM